jgi:hypothetical protein
MKIFLAMKDNKINLGTKLEKMLSEVVNFTFIGIKELKFKL